MRKGFAFSEDIHARCDQVADRAVQAKIQPDVLKAGAKAGSKECAKRVLWIGLRAVTRGLMETLISGAASGLEGFFQELEAAISEEVSEEMTVENAAKVGKKTVKAARKGAARTAKEKEDAQDLLVLYVTAYLTHASTLLPETSAQTEGLAMLERHRRLKIVADMRCKGQSEENQSEIMCQYAGFLCKGIMEFSETLRAKGIEVDKCGPWLQAFAEFVDLYNQRMQFLRNQDCSGILPETA